MLKENDNMFTELHKLADEQFPNHLVMFEDEWKKNNQSKIVHDWLIYLNDNRDNKALTDELTAKFHSKIKEIKFPQSELGKIWKLVFGKNMQVTEYPDDDEEDNRTLIYAGKTPDGLLEAFAHLKFGLRFNERSQVFEINYDSSKTEWQEIDDHEREFLRLTLIPKNFKYVANKNNDTKPLQYGADDFQRTLFASTRNRKQDPFKHYLEGLPKLDIDDSTCNWLKHPEIEPRHKLHIDNVFGDLYGQTCDGDDIRWHSYISRIIFLAQVHRTMNPGCKFDEVIVITGNQGVGKDALFKSMVPWMGLMTTSLRFSDADKVKIEKSLGKSIVVASEMAGLIKEADIDSVKQFITAQSDRCRFAYRTDPSEMLRRFIVVCTSNSSTPIPMDPSGNRRWLVVKLQAENQALHRVEDWFEQAIFEPRAEKTMKRRDIMWAEAMALYRKDSEETALQFPRYLKEVQSAKNAEYAKRDDQLESAWEHAVDFKKLDPTKPYTQAAIYMALGIIHEPGQISKAAKSYSHRVEDLMKGMKWDYKQIRVASKRLRCWVPHNFVNDRELNLDWVEGNQWYNWNANEEWDKQKENRLKNKITNMKGDF